MNVRIKRYVILDYNVLTLLETFIVHSVIKKVSIVMEQNAPVFAYKAINNHCLFLIFITDINECENTTICEPGLRCINNIGLFEWN